MFSRMCSDRRVCNLQAITQSAEKHAAELTRTVAGSLKKPIEVLEEKMKQLDTHMTKVDKHIVGMDSNMSAVMKALTEIQSSLQDQQRQSS
jgi:chromosome segregation ATPase